MTRHRRARLAAAPVVLLAFLGLLSGPAMAQRALAATTDISSQDTKLACAYTGNDLTQLQQFGWLVGRTMDCASVFNSTATTWSAWEDPWFAHMPLTQPQYNWRGWLAGGSRTLILTQSLVPIGIESNWRSLGAAGAYDSYIRALATNLVSYGMGNSIVRLAPEANGDWNFDDVGTTAQDNADWAAYWAHFVQVMKSVAGTSFQFDWTVNPGYRAIPFASYYPGDAAVDIVGIDQYDWASAWVGTTQPARWNYQYSQPLDMGDLVSWANTHSKPLSIPEWGLVPSTNSSGMGDDAYFADQIGGLVKNQVVRYESYFNATSDVTMQLQNAPATRAAWKRHFGASGDAQKVSPTVAPASPPTYPVVPAALDTKTPCLDESTSLSALQSFGWLTGKAMTCAVIHNDSAGSWAAWVDPWMTKTPAVSADYAWPQWLSAGNGTRTLILAQSLVPAGMPVDWRARGASGEYDAYVTQLGTNLVARGMSSVVIRLGAKANGDGRDSVGTTPQDYANWQTYFARAASRLRAVPGASFQIEWTVNAGYHAIPLDQIYPGDASVDIIGVAQYDSAPTGVGAAQPARWNYQASIADGVTAVVAYAQSHGKPLAISEWGGLTTDRMDGIGDDPAFGDQVAAIVRSVPTRYQAYVNTAGSGELRLQDAPGLRASWKRHFGAAGDAAR